MKKLLFVLFFIPAFISGQNWNVINRNYHYHYQNIDSTYITNTIFVVSLGNSGGDTIFYLNRVGSPCDTCNLPPTNPEVNYFLINQPQFLQRGITKTDSCFIFSDTSHFTIYTKKDSGFTWQFDDSIMATIVDMALTTTFGITDSTKTILLSTNDTIIISKNFGIKYFTSPYEHNKYELVGIETPTDTLGIRFPGFFDFFNFNVGDVFQYVSEEGDPCCYDNDTFKIIIQSKETIGDTLRYHAQKIGKHLHIDNGIYYFSDYNQNITIDYINSNDTYVNLYNGALYYENDTHEGYTGFDNNYILSYCYLDTLDSLYTKHSYCKDCSVHFPILFEDSYYNYVNPYIYEYKDFYTYEVNYKVGLGLTKKVYSLFEQYYSYKLVGYIKNGDTTGTVYSDGYLLGNAYVNSPRQGILVYPNPAKDKILVEYVNISGSQEQTIGLYDMEGHLLKQVKTGKVIGVAEMDVSGLPQGTYIIKSGNFTKQISVIH